MLVKKRDGRLEKFKEDLNKGFSVEKILEKYPPIIDDEYSIYLLESAIKEIISDKKLK